MTRVQDLRRCVLDLQTTLTILLGVMPREWPETAVAWAALDASARVLAAGPPGEHDDPG